MCRCFCLGKKQKQNKLVNKQNKKKRKIHNNIKKSNFISKDHIKSWQITESRNFCVTDHLENNMKFEKHKTKDITNNSSSNIHIIVWFKEKKTIKLIIQHDKWIA